MNAALVIIGLTTLGALALGLAAHRGVRMTLEQWTVAGRGFGGLLVFLLTAGEIYTTFTFLGGSGWAYGRGAPTLMMSQASRATRVSRAGVASGLTNSW